MYANADYIRLIASGLSATAGITIKEDNIWAVDVKKKTLHYKLEDLKYRPFPVVRGYLLHEIGHLKYTPYLKSKTELEKKYPNAMQSCYNAFEDIRIEGNLGREYGDFAVGALQSLRHYSISFVLQRLDTKTKKPRLVQFLKLCLLTYSSEFLNIRHANPYSILSNFDPVVEKRFDDNYPKIKDMVHNSLHNLDSFEDLKEVVDTDLYPIIKDFIEEFEKTAQQPATIKIPLPSWMSGHHVGNKDLPHPRILDLPTRAEALALMNPYISTLSSRLRDILIEKKATKWRGSHTKGKLLSKNAYKVCIPDEKRVFSKRSTPDTPDYSVYIALDSSGSMMTESRGVYASLASYLLEEVCRRLNFKTHFYSFTSTAKRLKDASEYVVQDTGTIDLPALKLIKKDINFSDNNLVIFITDGETDISDIRNDLMAKFKKEKAKVYGVGIGDGNIEPTLRASFESSVYVPKIAKLPLEMIRLLRREIKR